MSIVVSLPHLRDLIIVVTEGVDQGTFIA